MDKRDMNIKIKLQKLLIICFSVVFGIFDVNAVDPSGFIEYQDRIADQTALASVKSIAEFAALPDYRIERLNPAFVAELKIVNTRMSGLSSVESLEDLIDLGKGWLKPLIKLYPQTKLPASMYEGVSVGSSSPITANTIGTDFMYLLNNSTIAPTASNETSKALERLYQATVAKGITSDTVVAVDTADKFNTSVNTITFGHEDTAHFLQALSGTLTAGRVSENNFSTIQSEVIPSFSVFIINMINAVSICFEMFSYYNKININFTYV